MNGDFPKARFELDADIARMQKCGLLSVRCKPPAPEIPTLATNREHVVIGPVFAMSHDVPTAESLVGMDKQAEQNTQRIQTRLSRTFAGRMLRHHNEMLQDILQDSESYL